MTKPKSKLQAMKLLTLISEGMVEDKLIRDLKRQGVTGYTAWDVHGEGQKGIRRQEWEVHNVRLEFLLTSELADKVIAFLEEEYLPHYAITLWLQDVQTRESS